MTIANNDIAVRKETLVLSSNFCEMTACLTSARNYYVMDDSNQYIRITLYCKFCNLGFDHEVRPRQG